MTTIINLYRGQYRIVEDAVESWKADHDKAMAACDLEEIIRVCLCINERVAEFVNDQREKGFQGKVRNPEEKGKVILKLLKSGIEAWQSVAEAIDDYRARGYDIENSERVPTALKAVRALHDGFAARWPFVRKEDVERGTKQIAEGKCVTGEELLRELQSHSG